MKWINDFFRLDFVPERDGLAVASTEDKQTRQPAAPLPDNIHFIESQRAAFVQSGEEWTIWQADKRTAGLSDNDQKQLDGSNWAKQDKYRTIKSKWALNMSSIKASKSLTIERGRGFGHRTIEKYYSLINKAAAGKRPPIAKEGGGCRNSPQKEATILQNVKY